MENLIQGGAQSGPFFLKLGHFFDFQKRAGEVSTPSPLVADLYNGRCFCPSSYSYGLVSPKNYFLKYFQVIALSVCNF